MIVEVIVFFLLMGLVLYIGFRPTLCPTCKTNVFGDNINDCCVIYYEELRDKDRY
jgi:hypothetical protein